MTENKRYSLDFEECDAIWIDDSVKNKSYTIRNDTIKEKELEEIVDELNNLADENELLKREYKIFEEECQSTFDAMKKKLDISYQNNSKLREENEQLKQQYKELKEKNGILLKGWKKIDYSGLLNLMKDYNLNWDSVYEIIKEAVESNE